MNISSIAGITGYAGIGAYVASKWGLRGLTKAAALELAPDGTRVCSVHPGTVRTAMTADFDDSFTAAQPLPRFGEPEEVARMVLFIAADATYSTGTEDRLPDATVSIGGPPQRSHGLLAGPGVHVLLQRDATPPPDVVLGPQVSVLRLRNSPGRGLVAVRPDGHVGFRCGTTDAAGLSNWLSLISALASPSNRP
ncbi:SDR family oxidoreductase [Streptomyces canus]|uniref:SDR family NAD(P)-dependent oxidoreductase n=1 Tax=Streptomyces canus TaxID=58343 RepID=UPI003810D9AC